MRAACGSGLPGFLLCLLRSMISDSPLGTSRDPLSHIPQSSSCRTDCRMFRVVLHVPHTVARTRARGDLRCNLGFMKLLHCNFGLLCCRIVLSNQRPTALQPPLTAMSMWAERKQATYRRKP